MKTILLSAAATLALAWPSFAHEFTLGDLTVDHPMAFETPKTAKAGGGYLTVTNAGDIADRLIEVRADFPKVMLHRSVEEDGVAKMMHVDAVDVPANGTATLAPGGYHVMFMGLDAPLEEGDSFPATLVFEKAGEIEVIFNVEARDGDGTGHSDMNHSDTDHSGHSD